jgi:AAA domain-containing protein
MRTYEARSAKTVVIFSRLLPLLIRHSLFRVFRMLRLEPVNVFIPLYQRQLLAWLLQDPAAYQSFPSEVWKASYFDETPHRTIAYRYFAHRLQFGTHPSKDTLLDSLFAKWRNEDLPMTSDETELLQEFHSLYRAPVDDPPYLKEGLRRWAKQQAVMDAISRAVDHFQAKKPPEEIPDLLFAALRAVETEEPMAGKDFFLTPPTLPPEVFPGVLRVQSVGLLLGASKAHKSWTLLSAAVAVAMGKDWLGFPACEPKPALYLNLELHPEELKRRFDILCSAMGTSRAALQGRLDVLNFKGRSHVIENVLREIRFAARKRQNPWRLVVIDPVYKLYSGQPGENIENSNAAIGALFDQLEGMARELDAAILLAHHLKKGRNADVLTIDLGSGAGAFARGPDALIAFRPLEEEGCWRCELTLRYFPKIEPFGVRIDFPLLRRDAALDLDEVAGRSGAPKRYRAEDLVGRLPPEGMTNKEWIEAAEAGLGCGEKTFRKLRDDAFVRGLVRADGPSHRRATRYFATETYAEAAKTSGENRVRGELSRMVQAAKRSRIGGNGNGH